VKRLFLLQPLLLLTTTALAEPQEWMKKENPNELGVVVGADPKCGPPGLESLVHGVLTRSRIRPVSVSDTPELYLSVAVACFEISTQEGLYSYTTKIHFGTRGVQSVFMLYGFPDYGAVGVGGSDFIGNAVKSSVEEAITDYLHANFDL